MDAPRMIVTSPPSMDSQSYDNSNDNSGRAPLSAASLMVPASPTFSFLFPPSAPAAVAAMPRAAGTVASTKRRSSSIRGNPNSDR